MMRAAVSLIALALVLAALAGWWLPSRSAVEQPAQAAAASRIAEGQALYAEYCASCHGANLEGQPDWQSPGPDGRLPAPPHDETGHTWHHGDALLLEYIKLGGREAMARRGLVFDSGMPAFGDRLSDREITVILDYIKSTWSEQTRAIQAARTESE
jgi:mono/diheme cytochrome c family protein